MSEPCDHYGDQVAIRQVDLRDNEDALCSWCEESAAFGMIKSERHKIAFCEDCEGVIRALVNSETEDSDT